MPCTISYNLENVPLSPYIEPGERGAEIVCKNKRSEEMLGIVLRIMRLLVFAMKTVEVFCKNKWKL